MESLHMSLEETVRRLLDIEEIKALKARYLRCLDTKDWNGIADTFTADIHTAFSGGTYTFDGVPAVIRFFSGAMPRTLLTQHQCHTPEIWFESASLAHGRWYLQDYLIMVETGDRLQGTAIYLDTYRKEDGLWRICRTGYTRIFEERWKVSGHQLTQNMHGL